MSKQLLTLEDNKTSNVMKITRQSGTATKYAEFVNPRHYIMTCTLCGNKQDFDNMANKEMRSAVASAGWKEGINDERVHCLCPECVEECNTNSETSNKLSDVEYD